MKYKVRVSDKKTNEEKWTVEEIFDSEKAADDTINSVKGSFFCKIINMLRFQ